MSIGYAGASGTGGRYFELQNAQDIPQAILQMLQGEIQEQPPISGIKAAATICKYGSANPSGAAGSTVSDPVDTATGAHVISRELLSVNGAIPLTFGIRYNSLLLNTGSMGRGWEHNFETSLSVLADGSIKVYWSPNHSNIFTKVNETQFKCEDSDCCYDKLLKDATGQYILACQDQSVYKFTTDGRLIQLLEPEKQTINFQYDASGRLIKAIEPISGQYISLSYNARGLLEKVQDPLNRQVIFSYDGSGNLTEIKDAKGYPISYTYNSQGQILTGTGADGTRLFSDTYDAEGRVATQDDSLTDNQLTRFAYDESTDPGKLITAVTDRNGKVRVFIYDQYYNLLSIKDELGNITSYTYDANGNMVITTIYGAAQ